MPYVSVVGNLYHWIRWPQKGTSKTLGKNLRMIRRLLVLVILTLPVSALEVVLLKDGSRGLVLHRIGPTAWVGQTKPLSPDSAGPYEPRALQIPASELRPTHQQAVGMAVLVDPDPTTNLRSAPNGPVLRKLDGNSVLLVLHRGEWHQVLTSDGTTGYVHSSTVSLLTLDCRQDELDAICAPLIASHKKFCSDEPQADGRKRMYLSLSFGPLGRVVANTQGQVVLRETCSQGLGGGFSQDKQWLAVESKLVNPTSPYSADYPASKLLFHRVQGSYQLVLDTDFYSLDQLKGKGVPDSVIRGLCLPYPRSH